MIYLRTSRPQRCLQAVDNSRPIKGVMVLVGRYLGERENPGAHPHSVTAIYRWLVGSSVDERSPFSLRRPPLYCHTLSITFGKSLLIALRSRQYHGGACYDTNKCVNCYIGLSIYGVVTPPNDSEWLENNGLGMPPPWHSLGWC